MSTISKFCTAKCTALRNYETKTGVSKNPEYLQIEGAPCIVIESNSETNMITLNSLTSASSRCFKISREEFDINFTEINPGCGSIFRTTCKSSCNNSSCIFQ